MDKPLTNKELKAIGERVKRFMIENNVTCEEVICDSDRVIVNAYDFLTDLYNLVKDSLPELGD